MNIQQAIAIRGDIDSYERQENVWLLAELLNCDGLALKLMPEQELSSEQQQRYLDGIQRLNAGEPLAYILGHQPFWTLDLLVNEHTLIPRPDSEILVETILNLPISSNAQILDMGTGTGAIALSLAKERANWHCVLTDIHAETLNIAQKNAEKHHISNVEFLLGRWYQALEHSQEPSQQPYRFDVIVSNPPYLAEYDEHLTELLKFEPKRALVAPNHGLQDIIEIIYQAKKHLKSFAYVVIEHGWQQADAVQHIFQEAGFSEIRTVKDYGGNDRVTYARWVHDLAEKMT